MNFGISTACFYPMNTEEALLVLAKEQISNVEIFINTTSELKTDYVQELKQIADFHATKIVSMHPFSCAFEPFMLFTDYERRLQDGLEMHRHYFEAMNELGAQIFVFHGDRQASKNDNRIYFERFAKLRDLGKEYGIVVAQENVERCKSRDINFLCDMVAYLDRDVSLVFDNKQAIRSGIDYREFINCLGEHIVHVHLSDNDSTHDCLPLGKGQMDIYSFLSVLNPELYSGCIIIELYHELLSDNSEIIRSYDTLKALKL